ncbi:MAG: single-stranded DNA-binding protein [Anaerovibrio sp.]|uniref:single-stranded DNA-binding protein n=1 Tax=Anaerovibrio sp. TaxID=1872532 RepID=UPI0025E30703|nr:single-stranded DNA-binding protein [Anaerovibrio sp.]MCR5176648.1 single-stranded DNA-binding protein [Anaerovibrio sp.]
MNKVILKGRLSRDPELRYTTTNKAVTSFNIAVKRRVGSDNQGPTADFIPCIAWNKLAEIVANNLIKGSEVLIEGRMQVRSYDDQNGVKKYVTEVIVNEVYFCGNKKEKEDGGTPAGGNSQNDIGNFGGTPVSDDDIPF